MRAERRPAAPGARWIFRLAALLLLGGGTAFGEGVTLKATLILASNDPAPIDPRLERVEYKLRRIFGFEHYLYYGENSVTVELPADATLDLGHGYRLEISASKAKKEGIRVELKWLSGDQNLLSTRVVLHKNSPAILGGPAHEKGHLIVTLETQ